MASCGAGSGWRARRRCSGDGAPQALGVGRSDLRALNLLEHGPLGAAARAHELGLSRASVTALVDRLVAAGLVSRSPSPTDRRAILVALEPPVWAAFARVYRPLGERVHAAAAHLAGRDREVVIAVLASMVVAFDESREALASTPVTAPR